MQHSLYEMFSCALFPSQRMNSTICEKAPHLNRFVSVQVRLTLEGAPCIWTGAGFVAAADTALATPANFAPYLQSVPPELARHKDLLLTLGVRSPMPHKINDSAPWCRSSSGCRSRVKDVVLLSFASTLWLLRCAGIF